MKVILGFTFLAILLAINSCKTGTKSTAAESLPTSEIIYYNNPPAEGFNIDSSHTIAILLADKVMNALGGREQWDQTRYISWNFFGQRTWLWDRKEGMVRMDEGNTVVVFNEQQQSGKGWKNGQVITHADTVQAMVKNAYGKWINDSYWLLMPFKLKDSGVTLKYVGEDYTEKGARADQIQLTFEEVGLTPQNAYLVWIDVDSSLVKQWAWYRNGTDEDPVFVQSWDNYQDYGGIRLASERGQRTLTDIKVYKKIADSAFTSPEPYAGKEM